MTVRFVYPWDQPDDTTIPIAVTLQVPWWDEYRDGEPEFTHEDDAVLAAFLEEYQSIPDVRWLVEAECRSASDRWERANNWAACWAEWEA